MTHIKVTGAFSAWCVKNGSQDYESINIAPLKYSPYVSILGEAWMSIYQALQMVLV